MFDTSFDGPPGPALAAALPVVPPADMDDEQLIDAVRGWERLAAWVAAGQLAALAKFAHRRPRDLLDHPPGPRRHRAPRRAGGQRVRRRRTRRRAAPGPR
ncbi:MAG TPA: hypothetical protein VEL73_09370, partial [Mycobacteriales bacterium]|nr:hypothetical protein [Mycobacteriales bacterium]